MSDIWDRVKKAASEIYSTASERTLEGVNLGVKRVDLAAIRRDTTREFAALGMRVYHLLQKNEGDTIPSDPAVLRHLTRVRVLEERLEELEREIRAVREGKPSRRS